MKPISLKMTAFGSYANMDKEIDFTVPLQNLFLITGDTGSGKTTIFDAIVFALYGNVSSEAYQNKKKKDKSDKVKMVQSQFASSNVVPEVIFKFSKCFKSNDVYEIRRVPDYLRPLKGKNKGNKLETGHVSLIFPDGTAYTEKNVDEKIEEIVGLNSKQFMQVAMIAQGDFMKLLRATSTERVEIFRKLFNTEIFNLIDNRLCEKKKEYIQQMAKLKDKILQEISHVEIMESSSIKDSIIELKEELKESLARIDEFTDILWESINEEEHAKKKLEEDLINLNKKLSLLENEIAISKEVVGYYELKNKSENELISYEKDKPKYTYCQKIISNGDKIIRILPIEEDINRIEEEINKNHREKIKCTDNLENNTKLIAVKEKQQQTLSAQRIDCENKYRKLHLEIDRMMEIYPRINEAKKIIEKIKQDKAQCEKEYLDKNQQFNKLNITIEEYKKYINNENQCELMVKDIKNNLEKLEKQKEEVSFLPEMIRKAQNIYQEIEIINKNKKSSLEKYADMNNKLTQMNLSYYSGQAGILQKKLIKGKPCMVCGSVEWNLDLVKYNIDNIPDYHEIEQYTKEVSELLEEINKVNEICSKKTIDYEKTYEVIKEKTIRLFQIEIGELKDSQSKIMDRINGVYEEYNKTLEEYKRAESKVLEYLKTKELLEKANTIAEQLETERNKLNEDILKLQKDFSVEEAVYSKYLEQVTYSSEEEAIKTDREALEEYNMAVERENSIKQEIDKIKEQITIEKNTLDILTKNEAELLKNLENMKDKLNNSIISNGFSSHEDYLNSKVSEADIQNSKSYIDKYTEGVIKAQNNLKIANDNIGERQYPNIEDFENKKQVIVGKIQQKNTDLDLYKQVSHTNNHVYNNLIPLIKEREKVYSVVLSYDRLCKISNGAIFGGKTTMETYVQRMYMKNILAAANNRLDKMSNGEYKLKLKKLEDVGGQRNEGLDLIVYSYTTNSYRDIKTFSGGESFMAALALALGLADIIQVSSNSISLDMMFVDEGFGSLDDNSRTQAINILKELAGGNKLIGIISHVTELKTLIDDKLVVEKTNKGSKVHWEV